MKIQNARLDNRRREEKIEVVTDKKKKWAINSDKKESVFLFTNLN